jgi:hypothetical protein
MIAPRPDRRSGSARLLRLLVLLVPLLLVPACDDGNGTGPSEGSIEGTWSLTDQGVSLYLVITSSTLSQWVGLEERCFDFFDFEIVSRSGDTYTLREPGSNETFDVEIAREGDQLRVGGSSGDLYSPTAEDPSSLDRCVYPDDPGISCEDLPEIELGQTIDGELDTSDERLGYDGEYYDLYGLQLGMDHEVTIDLRATDQVNPFDPWLALFAGDGEFIAENDDAAGDTFDSRLVLDLGAGCYRVVVTTFDIGETGGYELSVN